MTATDCVQRQPSPPGWRRLWAALAAVVGTCTPLHGQIDLSRIVLSGDIRVRSELDARSAGTSSDHATLLRTRLGVLASPDSQISAFIQLADARAFGEEENTLTDASADRFDLHQAYIDWMPAGHLRLRVGRQELSFADERLIGPVGWVNVNRSFDGARATLTRGAWTVDAFGAVLDERAALLATGLDPRQNTDGVSDRSLYGVWATNRAFDVFAIADRNATDGGIVDVDRFTVGGYARRSFGRLSAKGMVALQFGRQTPDVGERQDITAYLLSASAAYPLPGDLEGSLRLQADVLSGDATPGDGTFSAFNTLYATNHRYYGFMDFFTNLPAHAGFLGLVDVYASATAQPTSWSLRADLHHFWLAKESPAGDRAIGLELDVTAVRPVTAAFTVQAGVSVFSPSAAAESVPISLGDELLYWAYLQGTMGFD